MIYLRDTQTELFYSFEKKKNASLTAMIFENNPTVVISDVMTRHCL